MALSFYNTYTRKLEEFNSIEPKTVRMYTCGPTVYDIPHIGNYRAYTFEDLLRRFLKFKGYKVTQVMNITDIEDKIIKKIQLEKTTLKAFTEKYIQAFFEDLKMLNIEKAEHYPKAAEHIPEMVLIIEKLLKNGSAYRGEDNSIYFSINKFKDYGKLSWINPDELIEGVRIKHDEYDKEKACDFALWKAYSPQDADVFWETSLGKGRPGWHIECSAMSMKYLGCQFDIHTGGVDNIFPHHENEIAQSEAYTGMKFVNYWLHNEHLLVDGKKMSKSLGNFYTLRDLIKEGYSLISLRYFYIANHYRSKLNFTKANLKAQEKTLEGLYDFLKRLQNINQKGEIKPKIHSIINNIQSDFESFMDEDLNSPCAIACIFKGIKKINKFIESEFLNKQEAGLIIDLFLKLDEVLGLNFKKVLGEENKISEEEKKLILERQTARDEKNWKRADEIREILKAKGIIIEDRKNLHPNIIIKR